MTLRAPLALTLLAAACAPADEAPGAACDGVLAWT
jgi:hypothetical protein